MGSVDTYKKWHKPNQSDNARFKQGYFHPVHPEKCLTKVNEYRSSWEYVFMAWLDRNPNIIRWASEPIPVKYLNPIKSLEYCKKVGLNPNDPHNWKESNYWTDFWWEIRDANGGVKKVFGEVKPYAQTIKPKPINEGAKLKEHKAYIRAANNYLVNTAKWAAAKKYFNERGCDFVIITEKTLKGLGLL